MVRWYSATVIKIRLISYLVTISKCCMTKLTLPTKTEVTAEIEIPVKIWEEAERRAAAAGGDLDEYLLDHLLIEYEFSRA